MTTSMTISAQPIRRTSPEELGVETPKVGRETAVDASPVVDDLILVSDGLEASDRLLLKTKELMADGFAGVILSGPPGTSKSWYARRLAVSISLADPDCVRYVQFHPSYQYEDFIESYEPTATGGFHPKARTFLALCEAAVLKPSSQFVLVIDELSRCDAVRVFGEALTYLEKSQRNVEFELASGRRVLIPDNLFIIATMNPWDRGVDELDMAFERRFAKIAMEPDVIALERILTSNGLAEQQIRRVIAFFRILQSHSNSFARIGHAYFARVRNIDELKRLWDHQLRFHFEKAFRQNKSEFQHILAGWESIFRADIDVVASVPSVGDNANFTELEVGVPDNIALAEGLAP
jgi:5-methylcytosine-specific restriction enzyme B